MRIVLNAGHAFTTPGKQTPDRMKEFEFNAKVAEYMRTGLLGYDGVEIKFTHDTSGAVDIPLKTRTNTANKWKADLWVGLHANAYGSGWNDAHGVETWVYTSASGVSLELANKVQAGLVDVTGLTNRGVKRGNLHEVRETHMPAILIEHAFMTNKIEAELLKSDEFRKKCAESNVIQIAEYYKLTKNGVSLPNRSNVNVEVKPQPSKALLVVDGDWGEKTTRELQIHFGTPEDGKISKPSMLIKAIQKKVGAYVDGYLGEETISKMQIHLGTPVDGKISKPSLMVKEMQRRLNEGRF